ncbi:MAG TPA: histone deacetylase family protein [Actinomycetes bacterium]|nr:histone deacetylase family protein [Actinomycetes bacterium]
MPPVTLTTPFIWSNDCTRHEPKGEIWVGVPTIGTEVAARATIIRDALSAAGAPEVAAVAHADDALVAVHNPQLVDWLRDGYAEWVEAGFLENPGQDRIVPYLFPTPAYLAGMDVGLPTGVHGRAGHFAYDTMTLVGPGTWEAARGAVDAALTAVDLVSAAWASGRVQVAYALCRPPGHHATRDGYGGSCYLNNAAVAANNLRTQGFERVAVIDIDAHHGNGTQALFYDRADVFYGSLHVDPAAGWFPHYVGHADERGRGNAVGTNRNIPLAEGLGDEPWLEAVHQLVADAKDFGADALVVSLGVDAAADDPESPLRVTATGYEGAGTAMAGLALPTVAVQEGGYHLETLGDLVVASITGLETRPSKPAEPSDQEHHAASS